MTTDSARRLLSDIAVNMAAYSDGELLRLKNSADTFSWMVRMELRTRDARAVDEICTPKGDAA